MNTEMNKHKTIGVLGGMGPAATVEYFRRLVAATPASADQDHIHILIDNDPRIPNRIEAILYGGPTPVPALVTMAKRLETAGAEILTIPCNTVHYYLQNVRAVLRIPVIDMIAETVARLDVDVVGLLATTGTVLSGLYQDACKARGIRVVVPEDEDQCTLVRAIDAIKAARRFDDIEEALRPVVHALHDRGAEAIIAGCTEISLLEGAHLADRWIDALDCLVDAALREAMAPGAARGAGKERDDGLERAGV